MTAAISQPDLRYTPNPDHPNTFKGRLMVLGICDDLPAAYDDLFNSDVAKKLIDLTTRGRLRACFPTGDNPFQGEITLKDEVCERGRELMYRSILQALAGPHKNSDKLTGSPVSRKLDWIYCDNVNNCNRAKDCAGASTDAEWVELPRDVHRNFRIRG